MPTIAADRLTGYVSTIFEAAGAAPSEAGEVATHMVGANLAGHDSHGVIHISNYLGLMDEGLIRPGAELRVERETETTALLAGGWDFGQVVARKAMADAIERARGSGLGAVVAYEMAHTGRMGAFGEQAVDAGMVGIALVQGRGHVVAPFGGAQGRLSTNPICIAAPTADPAAPFVLDMATSVVANGKVRVANSRGDLLPPEWALDADGRPTRDPNVLQGGGGSLLPLGASVGYKGFGLSLAVCVLAGALAPAPPIRERRGSSVFMLAIDIEQFRGRDAFAASLSDLIDYVRETPRRDGVDEILIAGEPERRTRAERLREGVPLDDGTWTRLRDAAERFGIEPLTES